VAIELARVWSGDANGMFSFGWWCVAGEVGAA
jgi:hypothetical protein